MSKLRPAICTFSDFDGGAARAAMGHHKALIAKGIKSEMIAGSKKSGLSSVYGPQGKFLKGLTQARRELSDFLTKLQVPSNPNLHSLQIFPSLTLKILNASDYDVVNLHWVCSEFLSIKDIGRLKKPLVWTMHDMWPILGAEHYVDESGFIRAIEGYKKSNRSHDDSGLDLDRWCWLRKKRHWKTPFQIVVSSDWMKKQVSASALMHNWPITVIPNALDMERFRPYDRNFARDILKLPQDKKILAFGATAGINDHRKGGDLLCASMEIINKAIPDLELVIFGQHNPGNQYIQVKNRLHWLGPISDDIVLSLIYSATNVIAVPSRLDNLPLTAAEAQACGCPVVAFNATGLPDLVEHGITGYLAKPFEVDDLARGIIWALEDPERTARLSTSARIRAKALWSYEAVVDKYLHVYEASIDGHRNKNSNVKETLNK